MSLLLLLALGAVFRAALLAVGRARRVERAANDVIAHAREILDASAAYEHDRVLLQVVADARDVGRDFFPVGQAHARHFTQGRVRLLGRYGLDLRADAASLRVPRDFKGMRRK